MFFFDLFFFDFHFLFFFVFVFVLFIFSFTYKNSFNYFYLVYFFVFQALVFILFLDVYVYTFFPNLNFFGYFFFFNRSIFFFRFLFTFFCLLSLFVLVVNFSNNIIKKGIELPFLFFISIYGLRLSCSSLDLFLVVLGFDLNLLCFLASIGISVYSNKIAESNMKFFIYSSFISGFMLFGLSLIYSIMGSLNFFVLLELSSFFNDVFYSHNVLFFSYELFFFSFGFFFFFIGLIFKLGVFPFHFWVIDVYEVASFNVLSFFSLVPKLAYLKVFFFWLGYVFLKFNFFFHFFFPIFSLIGLFSFVYGSIMALYVVSIRSFLAYGAVSNIGLCLTILQVNNILGFVSAFLFLFTYIFVSFFIFCILSFFIRYQKQRVFEIFNIVNFSLILRSNFVLGLLLAFFFFSLAGIPPFPGFFSKLFLVYSLWIDGEFFYSFCIMLFSVLSCVYYVS